MEKEGPFGIFWHPLFAKYRRNKRRGKLQKASKKSHSAEKNPSEKHQKGDPMFSRFWTSLFLFWTRFWRFEYVLDVVQVDDVEQMNKEEDRSRWTDEKKTRHCKSRAFSSKTPTKKQCKLLIVGTRTIRKKKENRKIYTVHEYHLVLDPILRWFLILKSHHLLFRLTTLFLVLPFRR